MDVAIIGGAGACGRQLAVQLLESSLLRLSSRLQLVGHHGGLSESELWGQRADLEDAFGDFAPPIEVVLEPADICADIVVMLAGRTLSTDPDSSVDRAGLGRANAEIFAAYAREFAGRAGTPPVVIVQSNPVELGVDLFARAVGRHRVVGAGAWSDTLRFRQEIAHDLGVRRPAVIAPMLGQHGDHLVPAWSMVQVRGWDAPALRERTVALRHGHDLHDLPQRIVAVRSQVLGLIRAGEVFEAYRVIAQQSADVRAAVKPFFTHYSAGHTTEVVTARAVADIIHALIEGHRRVMPVQVSLDGEWAGITGIVGAPVIIGPDGWTPGPAAVLAEDEQDALQAAATAVAKANVALLGADFEL